MHADEAGDAGDENFHRPRRQLKTPDHNSKLKGANAGATVRVGAKGGSMRVVTVGEEREHDPLLRALAAAGCPATVVGLADMPPSRPGDAYFYLGNAFEQIKTPFVLARIRRVLARDGAPYVWWNRDAPWNCAIKPWRKLFVRAARPADIHLAHSLQSADLFGEPVAYFPNAAETDRYHLGGRSLESLRIAANYRFEVSFVGTVNPGFRMVRARVEFLAELAGRLKREGLKLHIFDTSIGSKLTVAEQVSIIQASRINLNVGAVCDKPVRSWGIPERCFGIASCGGFLLCDERKHAADTFAPEAWADFSSMEECVARIKFFLAHFDIAREKAEKLHRIVLERHTYAIRAQQLLRMVGAWVRQRADQSADVAAA
jgi:spore maturation protein CgeB